MSLHKQNNNKTKICVRNHLKNLVSTFEKFKFKIMFDKH